MKFKIGILLAAVIVVAVGGVFWFGDAEPESKCSGGQCPLNKPELKVVIKDNSVNLGKVKTGKDHKSVFSFTNTSKKPVKISQIRKSCSCAEVEFDYTKEEIAPDSSGEITCSFPLSPGDHNFTLFVYYSNDEVGRLNFAYQGTKQFSLSAQRITWDDIVFQSPGRERQLTLYGDEVYVDTPIKFELDGKKPDWLTYRFEQNKDVKVQTADSSTVSRPKVNLGTLYFDIAAMAPLGDFAKTLPMLIKAKDETHKVTVECAGKVTPEIYSTLDQLVFLGLKEQYATFEIKSAGRPFKVLNSSCSVGKCSVETESEKVVKVTYKIKPSEEKLTDAINFKLDHPSITELKVPVSVIASLAANN